MRKCFGKACKHRLHRKFIIRYQVELVSIPSPWKWMLVVYLKIGSSWAGCWNLLRWGWPKKVCLLSINKVLLSKILWVLFAEDKHLVHNQMNNYCPDSDFQFFVLSRFTDNNFFSLCKPIIVRTKTTARKDKDTKFFHPPLLGLLYEFLSSLSISRVRQAQWTSLSMDA